jgi:hypothetical protein
MELISVETSEAFKTSEVCKCEPEHNLDKKSEEQDMTQLDRIEQKLDHLLRMIESMSVKQEDQYGERFGGGDNDGSKASKVPPRELRKWPEINRRGPKITPRQK